MIGPIAGITFIITWLVLTLMLTIGIYIINLIDNKNSSLKFWTPFPKALLAIVILTFTDWGIGAYYLTLVGDIAKSTVWFVVIFILFRIHFLKTLLLVSVLFLFKTLFIAFVISNLVPMIASHCL